MNINRIGFVGGGRATRIILQGLKRAGRMPGKVLIADNDPQALEKFAALFSEITPCPGGPGTFGPVDLVFLSVHPPVMEAVLLDLRTALGPGTAICSLALKVSVDRIAGALGGRRNVFRMNPNAPSAVGAGFNPVYFPPSFPAADKQALLGLLGALGRCPEVEEKKLEAFAVISAMGPTYLWFQLYALADLAKQFGLNDDEALAAVSGMAIGAGRTMAEAGLTGAEVMDLVPVKPLAENEDGIRKIYETKLTGLYAKLTS